MKITVVGGGNLGALLAANCSLVSGVSVTLLTRKPDSFSSILKVVDEEQGTTFESKSIVITADYRQALADAELILCTLPSFLRGQFAIDAQPYLSSNSLVGFVPGSGGVEFSCKNLVDKGITIFGLQRVPYICRMLEAGKTCLCKSKKKTVSIGTIPKGKAIDVCRILEPLLDITMMPLPNYLTVTLTPSNPILHTSRLYSLFKDCPDGQVYKENPLFYHEWTDDASGVLLGCDLELQELCQKIEGLDLLGVVSLLEHYESDSIESLTKKLRSIKAFSGIETPMIKGRDGYTPDWGSRYFTEDYPYGLAIIKGFAILAKCETPNIDKSLFWYQKISGSTYFLPNGEVGRDILGCGAPQRYGYQSLDEVTKLYDRSD
jgi:hypothetical protein